MSRTRNSTGMHVLLLAAALMAVPAGAKEAFAPKPDQDLRKLLLGQVGSVVTLQLQSGKELTGKLVSVGNELAHLSGLSGRDFYDAAVDLDEVEAVIVRVRSE